MNTFYLFTPEFKKWDNIVYLDSDILVRASLEKLSTVKGFWAVDDCRNLENQFINQKKDKNVIWNREYDKLLNKLHTKYNLLRSAFNAGVIAFSTDIVKENTFKELNELSNQYMQIAGLADQSILNLFFSMTWKRLPAVYNVFFVGPAEKKWLNCKKIKGVIIHLFAQNIPVKPEDCFYDEWMNNLTQADKICLDKKPFAKKRYNILESKLHFIRLIINCPRLIFWVFEIFLRSHLYYLYAMLVKCKHALKKND
jgi:lipopolysaccharide biosynthesis glycosyltransferase